MEKLTWDVGIYDIENVTNLNIRKQKRSSKYHRVWDSMLLRCSDKDTRKCYKDCTVCNEWLIYSIFVAWMETQDWKDKQLDKDIRVPGNKHYSPETCVFVTGYINSMFTYNPNRDLPTGVHRRNDKFVSRTYINGKKVSRTFNTIQEALDTAIDAKVFEVTRDLEMFAGPQSDLVKEGIMKHVAILLEGHSKNK